MKTGFTMAETLITLGIVAIIASVAMPAFKNLRPNQEMMMLKKAYYLAGRVVSELINDDEFYPENDNELQAGFSQTAKAQYHGHDYEGDVKFCGLFAARMNVKGEVHCDSSINKNNTFVDYTAPGSGHFTTNDDIVWVLPINNFGSGSNNSKQSIYVDVNGEKPGNCFATNSSCRKPDRFEIKVDRFGKIFVEDSTTRKYLSMTDTTKSYMDMR